MTLTSQVLLENRACLAEIDTRFAKLSRVVDRFFASHLVNNLANARRNISAHYDISNEMFMGTSTRGYPSRPEFRAQGD